MSALGPIRNMLCDVRTCRRLPRGVLSTAGGALAGRTSCRRLCSRVMVKIAWLRLDLQDAGGRQHKHYLGS